MIYKKLVVILVILIAVYAGFGFYWFFQPSETTDFSPEPTKGLHESEELRETPVVQQEHEIIDVYEFPENLNGFTRTNKKEIIYSENNLVKVWCDLPRGYFVPIFSYKMVYEKEEYNTLDIHAHIPQNKEHAKECFEANSNYFSNLENVTHETVDLGVKSAFFIDGEIFSTHMRALFMLDENNNYITFTNAGDKIASENFVSKDNFIVVASEFEVMK